VSDLPTPPHQRGQRDEQLVRSSWRLPTCGLPLASVYCSKKPRGEPRPALPAATHETLFGLFAVSVRRGEAVVSSATTSTWWRCHHDPEREVRPLPAGCHCTRPPRRWAATRLSVTASVHGRGREPSSCRASAPGYLVQLPEQLAADGLSRESTRQHAVENRSATAAQHLRATLSLA
jgi:hypothetical protein